MIDIIDALCSPLSYADFVRRLDEIRDRFEAIERTTDIADVDDPIYDDIAYECQQLSDLFNDCYDTIWQWFIDLEPYDEASLFEIVVREYNGLED